MMMYKRKIQHKKKMNPKRLIMKSLMTLRSGSNIETLRKI